MKARVRWRTRVVEVVRGRIRIALLDEADVVGLVDGQASIGQWHRTVLEEQLVLPRAFDVQLDLVHHAGDASGVAVVRDRIIIPVLEDWTVGRIGRFVCVC